MAVDPLDMVGVSLPCTNTTSNSTSSATNASTSASASASSEVRRLAEPYDRHRAHDLRAECYRRGIRPIKKGPHANDNKSGYMMLLRRWDAANKVPSAAITAMLPNGMPRIQPMPSAAQAPSVSMAMTAAGVGVQLPDPLQPHVQQQPIAPPVTDEAHADRKKRKTTPSVGPAGSTPGFFDGSGLVGTGLTSNLMTAAAPLNHGNSAAAAQPNPATTCSFPASKTQNDLEILSGIANSYTNQMGIVDGHGHAHGCLAAQAAPNPMAPASFSASSPSSSGPSHLCNSCRSHVTDQLMESIRLGRTKLLHQQQEKRVEIQTRHATLMREILEILQRLHQMQREMAHSVTAATTTGGHNHHKQDNNEEELRELERDIAFYRELKRKTRQEMKLLMQQQESSNAALLNMTSGLSTSLASSSSSSVPVSCTVSATSASAPSAPVPATAPSSIGSAS